MGKSIFHKWVKIKLLLSDFCSLIFAVFEARWPSGRVLDSGARGLGLDPHSGCRVVSLSKIHLPPKSTGNTQEAAVAPLDMAEKMVYLDIMQKRNKTENLFLQFLRHPHDLVVFEDTILWTDRAANKVRRCNKYSCEDKDMIGLKMEKPLGIVLNHPVRQKNGGYIFQVF